MVGKTNAAVQAPAETVEVRFIVEQGGGGSAVVICADGISARMGLMDGEETVATVLKDSIMVCWSSSAASNLPPRSPDLSALRTDGVTAAFLAENSGVIYIPR